jgi:hypothetical protein
MIKNPAITRVLCYNCSRARLITERKNPTSCPTNYRNYLGGSDMKKSELTGQRFGRLTALRDVGKNKDGRFIWECMCDCGSITRVLSNSLKDGHTQSCGCLNKEIVSIIKTKHGHSNALEYEIYKSIIQRCTNERNKQYSDYGGRGITICERWMNSVENFIADMGPRPSTKHSVERKDNSKGYSPENCKWATTVEQSRNRRIRIDNSSGVHGVSWNNRDKRWIANISVNKKVISLGSFKELEKAVGARRQAEIEYWNKIPS